MNADAWGNTQGNIAFFLIVFIMLWYGWSQMWPLPVKSVDKVMYHVAKHGVPWFALYFVWIFFLGDPILLVIQQLMVGG